MPCGTAGCGDYLKIFCFKSGFDLKERQSEFFGKLYELLSHIQQIKIHSIGKPFLCRLNTVFERLMSSAFKYQKITYLFSGLDSFILTLAQIFLFLFGGLQVIQGKLSVGNLQLYLVILD
ncbi:ABC transporter transmembrane domain-containing protein [Thermoanaerobacterium saccharolyticum]|uniref:ABC transporter transmembrane domain-containing protein n=1 Tax=Thermoanaerobacterium saccharolyticum TaxID=28896 RepID=UPI002FD93F1F